LFTMAKRSRITSLVLCSGGVGIAAALQCGARADHTHLGGGGATMFVRRVERNRGEGARRRARMPRTEF
jgi:hypothetical protein